LADSLAEKGKEEEGKWLALAYQNLSDWLIWGQQGFVHPPIRKEPFTSLNDSPCLSCDWMMELTLTLLFSPWSLTSPSILPPFLQTGHLIFRSFVHEVFILSLFLSIN